MGYIQSKRGDWKVAAESYSTAARIEPSAQQFRNLACAYNNLERYGEALGAYNAAIRAEPKDAEAFYGLGWVHDKLGRPCERCGTPIARVDFEEHTIYYCSVCQTGGRVLKDRRLSRLLK